MLTTIFHQTAVGCWAPVFFAEGISKVLLTMPSCAKRAYSTKPTMIAATGGHGTLKSRLNSGPNRLFQTPTVNPTAHDSQPARLNPARGPGHLKPANM